jgi:hypothetical protein
VARLVVDIGVGWRRFVRSQSAIPCAWVTLPRGIYRRAHVALRKAGVWLHVPGAGWGYEKTGTCTSPQEAWRCGDLKFPDTSNSCDLERARKTSERNERRRNNEQRPTDSDEPPLSPSPWTIAPRALSRPETPQFSNGGQSGEHVDSVPSPGPQRPQPRQRATRNPAARRTSRGRCANDLLLVAEPIVIDQHPACRGKRHRIIVTILVGGPDGTRSGSATGGVPGDTSFAIMRRKAEMACSTPNADSARPDPDRGRAGQQQA